MNRKTAEVFHALMKNGWIDRQEDGMIWSYAEESEVLEELDVFKSVMGLDFYRAGDRIYMIPTQDNDLFLKNNVDYRRDIKADNSIRMRDLYLLNYLSVYLLFLFFSGEGNEPLCRDFISKEEFVRNFTEHCAAVEHSTMDEDKELDYSENFRNLAMAWCNKLDGDITSQKFECKYGLLNRILNKYDKDELFTTGEDDLIRPTRKLKDLMPYFLRKDRIAEIQDWIREGETHAENQ